MLKMSAKVVPRAFPFEIGKSPGNEVGIIGHPACTQDTKFLLNATQVVTFSASWYDIGEMQWLK